MSEKQKLADKQKVDGQDGRQPTEGKWVAEPRDPDPKVEGDAISRLATEKRDETKNPQNRQLGPDEDDIEEKVVESGVEETKLEMETEEALMPHKLPGT